VVLYAVQFVQSVDFSHVPVGEIVVSLTSNQFVVASYNLTLRVGTDDQKAVENLHANLLFTLSDRSAHGW
jgi:hypothetical protein